MSETIFRYCVIGLGVFLMFSFEHRFKKRGDTAFKAWIKGFGLAMLCVLIIALLGFALVFK